MKQNYYDVIVIGAGHAGCEAALASARTGAATLLFTINMDHIAQMSCNPAVGGIAKGQVVREIDALGGAQGRVADASAIQFRMLNIAKGPAVWSPRSQCDKVCYQRAMKFELEKQPNLSVRQGLVVSFYFEHGNVSGVETVFGEVFTAKAIVITTGTFLSGLLHFGMRHFSGGRAGDPPSDELAAAIRSQLQLSVGRLKTGTPPRILSKTIDFSRMDRQSSDNCDEYFSYFPEHQALPRAERRAMDCYLVYSTSETAELVRKNLHLAPLYQGKIKGIGTRYCPSFEDKVVRFPHHEKHLLYLEPEGEFTGEYYINGISTSLPPEIQTAIIHTIPGLENAEIARYAYAIEYDFVFPHQLERTLGSKRWPNLFLAGQINGTSGYEEAAGQGLIAGLNASRYAAGKNLIEISRDSCYIGVMIDDLVTKDIVEPYRLFTSRAEYRLHLRQDNADIRLCEFAWHHGLLPEEKYRKFKNFLIGLEAAEAKSRKIRHQQQSLWQLLKQYGGRIDFAAPLPFPSELLHLNLNIPDDRRILRQLVIKAHYEGYLERENTAIGRLQRLENWKIPAEFNYQSVTGLRHEARAKLLKVLPTTLAQASRIDGVTPAELALLQVHLIRFREHGNLEFEDGGNDRQ